MALRMVFGLAGGLAAVFGQSLFALPLLALAVWPQFGSRALAVIRTLPRDTQFLWRALNSLASLKKIERRNENVPDVFNRQLQAFPNKALIHFNDQTWTFKQMAEYSNRVANTFKDMGFRKGDVVALFMNNCPEYVGIWLGLSKLGVITALVNHNQRNKALIHSCTASHCSAVIFGSDLAQAVIDVSGEVGGAKLLQLSTESGPVTVPSSVLDLNALLDKAATTEPVCKEGERPGYKDILLYVYTSGTTGLPKAAKITHSRYIAAGRGIPSLMGMSPQDVVYAPLPLYHSAGGMCALGYGLMFGMTVVLRAKFSASAFLSDCVKHKCTVVQYVGEICRYVLATPPKPTDTQHSIRVIIGNGMRVSVWQKFVERFRVAQVVELYGSTEGNVTFFNLDNTLGAVGFLPRFLPLSIFPIGFVRVNQETGDIIRNKDGLCERCEVNEPGMLVGHISDKDPSREFHGYADDSSSEKKILRDVYQKGDKWFLSGDILVMDNLGYIFFRDRTGDTFRWKGENVSTTEVEATVSAAVGNRDIAVYGVEVAGSEGRAGMVAIADPDGTVNLDALAESVDRNLPVYARPLFVRLPPALEKTGTFKIVKVNMQREGYDPSTISDPLFIRNGKKFVPLTPEVHNDLCSGKLRL